MTRAAARHPLATARALAGALGLTAALALSCLLAAAAPAFDRGADGEYERRESSHFVLFQDVDIDETSGLRGSRRFEQQVLAVLEDAFAEADERLGVRPERKIVVIVYDAQVFDRELAGSFRYPVAGFYGGRVHVRGDTVVSDRLVAVLRHEYVHAVLDATTGATALPAWLNEGVAEWFEARAAGHRELPPSRTVVLQQLAARGQLFSLDELAAPSFGAFGPDGARVAYLQSWSFVDYLARLRGERALRDWIREVARTADVERATRRTFRADVGALHRDHLDWLAAGA